MLRAFTNEVVFPIRSCLPRLRPRRYEEKLNTSISQDFIPHHIAVRMKRETLLAAAFYGWMLSHFDVPARGPKRAVDIGSKNFFYAPALYRWLIKQWGDAELEGLEADPARLYVDGYRRCDYAHYYTSLAQCEDDKNASTVRFCTGNWITWLPEREYSLVICFFPFLYEDLHDNWGLPRSYFSPRRFYEKCAKQSPYILFFHQGEEELKYSLKLIHSLGKVRVVGQKEFYKNPYVVREHPVYGVLWKRV